MAEPNTEDARLLVRFYIEPVKLEHKSEEAGRPIYEDQEFVSIIVPGDTKTVVVKRVTDEERERFALIYAAFERSEAKAADGTSLDEWPSMTKSRARELKEQGIKTVEQLERIGDTSLDKYGPTTIDERTKAKAFLAKAADGAAAEKTATELSAARDEIARLKKETERLSDELEKATKKKAPAGT